MFLKPKALLRVRGEEFIPGEPSDEEDLKSRIDAPIGKARQSWTPDWPDLQYLTAPIGSGRIGQREAVMPQSSLTDGWLDCAEMWP